MFIQLINMVSSSSLVSVLDSQTLLFTNGFPKLHMQEKHKLAVWSEGLEPLEDSFSRYFWDIPKIISKMARQEAFLSMQLRVSLVYL